MAYYPTVVSTVSTANSTTTPLSAGATFTGSWEDVQNYPSVSVTGTTDVLSATLYADFSQDGITSDSAVQLSNGQALSFGIHTFGPTRRYFRVRVVNGSNPMGTLRVQTILHAGFSWVSTRAAQQINDYSTCLLVRESGDPRLDEVASRQDDRSVISKFGFNSAVPTGGSDIWGIGGAYTGWLTAASTVRIKAGGNVNDTAAGTGAQSITIVGLDENWAEASETVATAGASASSSTTTTFIRVYRAYVANVGTYGGANAGTVTIETTGGTALCAITAAYGQTTTSNYTVPAGYIAYLRAVTVTAESAKANVNATVRFMQRQNSDDVSTPFTGARIIDIFPGVAGHIERHFTTYRGPYPAKTDLWETAASSSSTIGVATTKDIVLIRV